MRCANEIPGHDTSLRVQGEDEITRRGFCLEVASIPCLQESLVLLWIAMSVDSNVDELHRELQV